MQKSPKMTHEAILKPGRWEIGDFTINFWWNIKDPNFIMKKLFFSLILQKYMEKRKIEWKKYFWPLLSPYKQPKSQILEKWVKIVVFSNFLYDYYTLEFLIFSHSPKSFIKFLKKILFPPPLPHQVGCKNSLKVAEMAKMWLFLHFCNPTTIRDPLLHPHWNLARFWGGEGWICPPFHIWLTLKPLKNSRNGSIEAFKTPLKVAKNVRN